MPEWISVKDRLPEEDGWCIVYDCDGYHLEDRVRILRFTHSVKQEYPHCCKGIDRPGWVDEDEDGRYYEVDVTHWMPFTEPPDTVV